MKRKVVSMFLAAAMSAGILTGCGDASSDAASGKEGKVINIYCLYSGVKTLAFRRNL